MHADCAMQAAQHWLSSELGISASTFDPALQPSRKVALQVTAATTQSDANQNRMRVMLPQNGPPNCCGKLNGRICKKL
jgi:hypothetical protein